MFFPIFCLCLLFAILLIPAYPKIFNAVRSIFAAIICKEIISKPAISNREYALLIRHMRKDSFVVLRKLIVKRNLTAILEKLGAVSLDTATRLGTFYDVVTFSYYSNFKSFGDNKTTRFSVALRNIGIIIDYKNSPHKFDKIQNLVIDKAREFNMPDIIYQFAVACEDFGISYRKLYNAIVQYKSSPARRDFELRYKNKPEIERLITLSP